MKKLISLLLVLLMICSALPLTVSVYAATDDAVTQPATETPTDEESSPETTVVTEQAEPIKPTEQPETTEPTEEPSTAPTETESTEPTTVFTEPTSTQPTKPVKITPKPVKNLKVISVTTSAVKLKWNASADATKYIIYRASEKSNGKYGDYKKYKTLSKSQKTFKDKGLSAGRAYKYKIYAYRIKDGYTTHSKGTAVAALTKLDAVKKIVLKNKNVDSITVKWTAVKNAGKYIIYRSDEKSNGTYGAYKAIKTVKNDVKTYLDTKLAAGRIYKYKIIAQRKKSGITVQSKGTAIKGMTALKAPNKFVLKKVTSTAIKVAWSKVGMANRYELYRDGVKITTTDSTSYSDYNISTGQNYTYKVRALRVYKGKNHYGGFISLTAATAVNNVGGITVKSYNRHGLFTWQEISGASGYDVYVKNAKGKWIYKGNTTIGAYLTGRLKLGKTYKYAFKAYKLVGGTKIYSKAKTAKVRVSDGAYGRTVSGTWVEVCTETQTMTMYVNNKAYITTPVVTGNYGPQGTTHGYHNVISRKSPARLRGSYNGHSWDVNVSYWLGFTSDGQGIHDATWRGAFGGNIYKGNGSNGCVNTPISAVSKIYAKAYLGMPVIVY